MPSPKVPEVAAARRPKKTPATDLGKPASELIDARVRELADWRGELLAHLRAVILSADPGVIEEWKWNTPVWSCNGILCTGETYKSTVKLTFAKGASIPDPSGLFNSSLDGNVRRAIDFKQGASVDETALRLLLQSAIEATRARASMKP
jgi:hypothetical protein